MTTYHSDDEFNLLLGEALKISGMERSAEARKACLEIGRLFCEKAARSRPDRIATADDATRGFKKVGLPVDCLGNAAGSLFKKEIWIYTGDWVKSKRITNHARHIRIWRLAHG